MMAVLILSWCLATCETVYVPVRITMIECAIHGPRIAAQWQRENPGYAGHTLRRWRCEHGERA